MLSVDISACLSAVSSSVSALGILYNILNCLYQSRPCTDTSGLSSCYNGSLVTHMVIMLDCHHILASYISSHGLYLVQCYIFIFKVLQDFHLLPS
jgi:hypothetical protein